MLQQRVADGEINLKWISDAGNPADFLTKWVSKKKLEASVKYTTGRGDTWTSQA